MTITEHNKARNEFLTDGAFYFRDKPEVYLAIKDSISSKTGTPTSMIRVCGSAYWGKSFKSGYDFRPSVSDLDIALIDAGLFVTCLSEVRKLTWNFTNLTKFNVPNSPQIFQDYAYKKGMIRVELMPLTNSKSNLDRVSQQLSEAYAEHFSKVSIIVYDTENSFTVKQISSAARFVGTNK
jgi:hypothetical protein